MKLGYINYLNCYPFYFHMFERRPLEGIEVVRAYPSELNRMLAAGDLHMSAISAGALADMDSNILLVPHFCLSSVGYVRSVLLRSMMPIEDLHGRKVGISTASRTSEALLKILLHRYYHVDPIYKATPPDASLEGLDAALVIGNEAMKEGPQLAPFIYDLGELWLRKTGFPVVFAVFAARDESVARYAHEIEAVVESYRLSLESLVSEEGAVVAAARAEYPDVVYDVASYYHLFTYNFSDTLKEALRFYLDAGRDLGLFPRKTSLRFLDFPGEVI